MDAVAAKRRLGLDQFDKTDLNKRDKAESMCCWYDALADAVRRSPPDRYVDTVLVSEKQGIIIRVDYIYSEREVPAESIGFTILTDRTRK